MSRILTPEALVDAAVCRFSRWTERDAEFKRRFGRWTRPSFARRYPLAEMKRLIRWSTLDPEILDLAPFINEMLKEDRRIAGEIALFVFEEFRDAFATDKTLNLFRLSYLRRLDTCGF